MTITIDYVTGFLLLLVLILLLFLTVFLLVKSVRPSHPKSKTQLSTKQASAASSLEVQVAAILPLGSLRASGTLDEPPIEAIFIRDTFHVRHTPEQLKAWDSLTPRKVEVALRVARGLSNAEVAVELKIQKSTVEGYLKEIYRALNLRSRTELANFVRDLASESPLSSTSPPPNFWYPRFRCFK